jgi:hypothetical protein
MSSNVGGTAASGGFDFQHRVAAWIAVRILAEKDATEIWGLNDSFTFIRCETEQPVDDILIGIGRKGFAFLQTKRTSISRTILNLNSPLPSANSVVNSSSAGTREPAQETGNVRSIPRQIG